ncbi:unnamed protein product [Prorocentrum cordatum]|uniref:Mei2-like C-terminal RNA recognition motif domain-containing protein n=1 Tax=Prorocentrum cordatum TaxID=2364126 RepID=A0ABN9WEB0_9DINO|nr:unnamed protein product [Polarella glacialis]
MAVLNLSYTWSALHGEAAVPEELASSDDLQAEPPVRAATVNLTLTNVPCRCTIEDVLDLVHDSGFKGHFDRLFMPMKSTGKRNRGYLFVTFTDPRQALLFQCAIDGMRFSSRNSPKEIVVVASKKESLSALQNEIPLGAQVFMSRWGRVMVPPSCTFSL